MDLNSTVLRFRTEAHLRDQHVSVSWVSSVFPAEAEEVGESRQQKRFPLLLRRWCGNLVSRGGTHALGTVSKIICVLFVENSTKPPPCL